jgi:hypothetical protein
VAVRNERIVDARSVAAESVVLAGMQTVVPLLGTGE